MKFTNHKYTWQRPFTSTRHNWEVVGPKGAVHFHASINDDDKYDPICGMEFHYCEPPEYMKNHAPSHVDCKLTGGRCWHDGTSLYASQLWPRIEAHLKSGAHKIIFGILESEYDARF
jgi:hypothetical protein